MKSPVAAEIIQQELDTLRSQWEADSHRQGLDDNGTWMRAVAYGIQIAAHVLKRHAITRETKDSPGGNKDVD